MGRSPRGAANLVRRDLHNADQLGYPHDYLRSRLDEYLDDLNLHPRARQDLDQLHRNWSLRRPLVTTRTSYPINRSTAMEPHGSAMARRQTPPSIPFGIAIRKLHDQLKRSKDVYAQFLQGYDDEVSHIKNYASADTMNELWTRRIVGRRDPKSVLSGEVKEDDENLLQASGYLDDAQEEISRALKMALDSWTKAGVHSMYEESAQRLKGKINLAANQTQDLFNKFKNGRQYCVALMQELTSLEALVDPQSENNLPLHREFNDIGDGNDDGYPEDGGLA